jgi:hypothetical protein
MCWDLLEQRIAHAADVLCPIIELRIHMHTLPYINTELLDMQRNRYKQADEADRSG